MSRREPPPIAAWALEHLTFGDRDEALAGDLLEALQNGRSNTWYWRQALMACAVSWSESFRERASLLIFALLWSMAAPGWDAICAMANVDHLAYRFISILRIFWLPLYLLVWTTLHSLFLWAGLLIFSVFHLSLGGSFDLTKFKRAFLLVPAIIVPAYFVMFVVVDLYWYAIFEHVQPRGSPLSQMVDLRLLADVIRIPYFLALAWALWGTVRTAGRASFRWLDASAINPIENSDALASRSMLGSFVVRRFFPIMVVAGLLNATIAGLLLCRLPESHSPTLASLLPRAALYMLAGALAGVGGTYLYWRNPASPFRVSAPLPFPLFALICAAGWVWMPAMVILSEQTSPAFAFVALIGVFVLTSGLRRVSSVYGPIPRSAAASETGNIVLFSDVLYPAPVEMYGYVVALSLYAGAIALCFRWRFTAAVLFMLAASVFAWKKTLPQNREFDRGREQKRAALRLAVMVIPALLVTAWAMLDGVTHRNAFAEANAVNALRAANSPVKDVAKSSGPYATALGTGGYESVILWPYPDKLPAISPVVGENAWLRTGSKEPLVIRFNGPYWYFQPPKKSPGSSAHLATGTPISFDIRSSNAIPLVMNAHQYLSTSIPVERCREIAVDIENRDNTSGEISLGVLLTSRDSTKDAALYLVEQPILSTRPGNFAVKRAPVLETLYFSIPTQAKIRNFSEITVLVFPDIEHTFDAPKIAIQQFQLFPR